MASAITQALIAPCGMNCAVCRAHVREHNRCPGCKQVRPGMQKTRVECRLRRCRKRTGKYCCACAEFPCALLRRLDLRYRNRYGTSQIANLEFIGEHGLRRFVQAERARWENDAGVLCVHDGKRYPR